MRTRLLLAASVLLFTSLAFADNTDRETDEALSAFKKGYSSKEESERIVAIETVATTQSKRVVEALSLALGRDPSSAVRRAAAKAIGSQWSPNAVTVLVKALDPENAPKDVTVAIIAALGRTESDHAVPPLLSLLTPKRRTGRNLPQGEEDTSIFTGPALDALKRIGSATAAEELVSFTCREAMAQNHRRGGGGENHDPLSREAEAALAAITGEKLGTSGQWRRWWFENKDGLKTVAVFRCAGTGRSFDKPDARTKCPFDGDQHPGCGVPLKTRYEGGGLAAPDAQADNPEKKGKKAKGN